MTRSPSRIALLACGLLAAAVAGGEPNNPDSLALMRAIDARPRGGDQRMIATWRLLGKRGAERVRTLRSYWKDYRGERGGLYSKRIVVFDAPPDLADTAFLVVSYLDPSRDDDRWTYLPALRKVRRIAGNDRGQSFFGTDFAYEDLAERDAEEDEHAFVRSEPLGGVPHQVIDSTPRDPRFPYAKRRLWVNPASATVSRIEFVDRAGRTEKVLTIQWQEVGGIWAWSHLEMETLRTRHRTVVDVREVAHGRGLGDALFSEGTLRMGAPSEK